MFVYEPLARADASYPLTMPTKAPSAPLSPLSHPFVTCYSSVNAFDAKLTLPPVFHVGRINSIELECSSGWNMIERADIRLKAATAGLRLHTADANIVDGNCSIVDASQPGLVQCTDLRSYCTERLRIPYDLENEVGEISVGLEITYSTANGEFVYFAFVTLAIELPLDVEVHDVFNASSLFSRFNIRAAGQVPLEIHDVQLHGSDALTVEALGTISSPMLALFSQPLALTYCIKRKKGFPKSGGQHNPPLALALRYRSMAEMVRKAFEKQLTIDLQNSPFQAFSRLLLPTMLQRLQSHVAEYDLQLIGLAGTCTTASFEQMQWDETLDGLTESVRNDLRDWLKGWHGVSCPFRQITLS